MKTARNSFLKAVGEDFMFVMSESGQIVHVMLQGQVKPGGMPLCNCLTWENGYCMGGETNDVDIRNLVSMGKHKTHICRNCISVLKRDYKYSEARFMRFLESVK